MSKSNANGLFVQWEIHGESTADGAGDKLAISITCLILVFLPKFRELEFDVVTH